MLHFRDAVYSFHSAAQELQGKEYKGDMAKPDLNKMCGRPGGVASHEEVRLAREALRLLSIRARQTGREGR